MRGWRTFRAKPDDRPTEFARNLRRNMTDAERKLWRLLRGRRFAAFKFRRQVPIGRYIADFVCLDRRLIVELDGGQHAENLRDGVRDAWLATEGYRVLRLWNTEFLTRPDDAMEAIWVALGPIDARTPSSAPPGHLLPGGEKGEETAGDAHDGCTASPSPRRGESAAKPRIRGFRAETESGRMEQ